MSALQFIKNIFKRTPNVFDMAKLIRFIVYKTDYSEKKTLGLSGTRFTFTKKFKVPNTIYTIIFNHLIRGSLVEIVQNEEVICGYVDQTEQWNFPGFGLNDIDNNLTKEQMECIITELKKIKKGT